MNNLLKETMYILASHGKTTADVLWVGDSEFRTDWEGFAKIADINYDNGYGGAEIKDDLLIVGKNWWLERGEYDGSEWWEYKEKPSKPRKIATLVGVKHYYCEERNWEDNV